jgi:hypothetical protein
LSAFSIVLQKTLNRLEISKSNGWKTLVKLYQMEVSVNSGSDKASIAFSLYHALIALFRSPHWHIQGNGMGINAWVFPWLDMPILVP